MDGFGPGDMPRDEYTFATIQFFVPKTVGNALNAKAIRAAARAAGLQGLDSLYEWSTVGTPPGRARITCSRVLVPFIVDAFRGMAATSQGELLIAAAEAAIAGLDVLAPRLS